MPAPTPESQTRPARAVLVDDEPHITHMISRKLQQAGFEVRTAPDGRQGLDLIKSEPPDLVITDLQMPYMSGVELATRLWKSEQTCEIPIVMLTARGFMVEREIRELGNIKALLSKPFSPRSLLELAQRVLRDDGESAETQGLAA